MPRQEKYYLGPDLLSDIRRTVTRVDASPYAHRDHIQDIKLQSLAARSRGSGFRICTFTGSWSKTTQKTVTFKYQTATPNTVVATNLFADVTATATLNCAIAREGTAWFLIAAEC